MIGKILIEELPYACAVKTELSSTVCSFCFHTEKKLYKCSKCKHIYYCDSKCQRSDWAAHKLECDFMTVRNPKTIGTYKRLFLRCLISLMLKPKEKGFNGRTFDSLFSPVSDISERHLSLLDFVSCKRTFMMKFSKSDLDPDLITLKNYGKILVNAYEICDWDFRTIGIGVYLGLSVLDHSCRPNACVTFLRNKAVLKSLDNNISEFSDEIRISYLDGLDLIKDRQAKLSMQYFFVCHCPGCEDRQAENMAESFRCDQCETGYLPYNSVLHQLESCIRCSNDKPTLPIEKGLQLMKDLRAFYNKYPNIQSQDEGRAFKLYRYAKKHLSPCNLLLSRVADCLGLIETSNKHYGDAMELIEKALEGYKKYYPACYGTQLLKYCTLCQVALEIDKKIALVYLHQIIKMLEILYGDSHPIMVQHRALLLYAESRSDCTIVPL